MQFLPGGLGGGLVEASFLQGAAGEDMAILARHEVVTALIDDAGQALGLGLVEQHLAAHWPHGQVKGERTEHLPAPGAAGDDIGVGLELPVAGMDGHDPVLGYLKACHGVIRLDVHPAAGQGLQECTGQARVSYLADLVQPEAIRRGREGRRCLGWQWSAALAVLPDRGLVGCEGRQDPHARAQELRVGGGMGPDARDPGVVAGQAVLGQAGHRLGIVPGQQQAEDAGTGPGRFPPRLSPLQDHDPGTAAGEFPGGG